VEEEPQRVSVCHCLACQRRTGSPFGVQGRFERDKVQITGTSRQFTRASDEDDRHATFHFCPECGDKLYWVPSYAPDILIIPVGVFADPKFPSPTISVWEDRMHHWVSLPPEIEHFP
jgi:hypothetical protein